MIRMLIVLLLLAGCAGIPGGAAAPEAGSLTLLQALTIPPASATLRLQYGQPVARNAVQEQDPFCVFEIETVSDSPQIVHPDTFRILRIGHSVDNIASLPYAVPIRVGRGGDSMPSQIYYKTWFWLHSAQQPRVRLLTCMSNQYMPGVYPFMRHLTLPEMRAALGADFHLELR